MPNKKTREKGRKAENEKKGRKKIRPWQGQRRGAGIRGNCEGFITPGFGHICFITIDNNLVSFRTVLEKYSNNIENDL